MNYLVRNKTRQYSFHWNDKHIRFSQWTSINTCGALSLKVIKIECMGFLITVEYVLNLAEPSGRGLKMFYRLRLCVPNQPPTTTLSTTSSSTVSLQAIQNSNTAREIKYKPKAPN